MASEESLSLGSPAPERSGLVDSPERWCVVCGGPLGPRKQAACSDACRTALNRKRKAEAERNRKEEIRALREAALKRLRDNP
jgi:predicted nucleic acid-binding Zn ribbon protein